MDSVARDLLRCLQGIARARFPDHPYLWIQVSRSDKPRRPFAFARDAVVVSLTSGRGSRMAAGVVVQAELCEPGVIVSYMYNIPVDPKKLWGDAMLVCANAGVFVSPCIYNCSLLPSGLGAHTAQ